MIINQYERPAGRAEPKVSDPLLQELDGRLDDPRLTALVRQDLKQHTAAGGAGGLPFRSKSPCAPAQLGINDRPATR
jgi:hypothetical protein